MNVVDDERQQSPPIKWRDRGNGRKKTAAIQEERGNDNNMNETKYIVASEVAKMIGSKWTRSMVHTYLKRGKFPDPATYAGNQPLWTIDQVIRFKKERGIQ